MSYYIFLGLLALTPRTDLGIGSDRPSHDHLFWHLNILILSSNFSACYQTMHLHPMRTFVYLHYNMHQRALLFTVYSMCFSYIYVINLSLSSLILLNGTADFTIDERKYQSCKYISS